MRHCFSSCWGTKWFLICVLFCCMDSASMQDRTTCSYVNSASENANIRVKSTKGEISSPGYPRLYSGQITCIWTIKVPRGFKVKLTFTEFKLNSSADNLEVRDGSSFSSLMGTFTDVSNLPPDLYTSGRTLWLKFIIDSSGSAKGFHALYSAVTSAQGACSTLNTHDMNTNIWKNLSSDRFFSPRYPANYPSDIRCVWRIIVPDRCRIRLSFRTFSLEGNPCNYDYVEIRDGLRTTSPLIGGGRICGHASSDTFYHSSGPNMLVLFSSDPSEQFKGFEAFYSSVLPEPRKCSSVNTMEENNNIHLYGTSGVLSSPNFPNLFPNNMQCTWTITVPVGYRVVFQVSSFHLESHCLGEYLDIRDGPLPSSPHRERFCGPKNPFHVLSYGRSLWIRFKSNSHIRHKGFKSSFVATPSGPNSCSRENSIDVNNHIYLNETSGQLSSPEFPLPYDLPTHCTWVLEARARHRLELTFNVVDLPSTCDTDYVKVCEGRYDCILATYTACGKGHRQTATEHVYSRGRHLWVHFRFSGLLRSRFTGFKATYRQIPEGSCSIAHSPTYNQNLWLTQSLSGTISSPGYPASIGQPIQCYWKIIVPADYTIKLSFEVFYLPSCIYSCLRIYNGLDSSKTLLAKLSGEGYSQTFLSSGRSMLLKFGSISNLTYIGNYKFKASYVGLKTRLAPVTDSTFRMELAEVLIVVTVGLLVLFSLCTVACVICKFRRRGRNPSRDTSSLSRVSSFRDTQHPVQDVDSLHLRRLPNVVAPSTLPETTSCDSVLELPTISDLSDLNIVEEIPPSYDEAVQSNRNPQNEPEVEREGEISSMEETQDSGNLGQDNEGFVGSTTDLSDQPPPYSTLFRTRESRNL